MHITREMNLRRLAAGYFEPPANPLCCAKCGKAEKRGRKAGPSPFFCRLHKFFVRRDGVCPEQSPEPWNPKPVQEKLGELFDDDP